MSRCVTLYRPPPTVEDLSITAQGMVQSVSLLEERRTVEIVVILVVGGSGSRSDRYTNARRVFFHPRFDGKNLRALQTCLHIFKKEIRGWYLWIPLKWLLGFCFDSPPDLPPTWLSGSTLLSSTPPNLQRFFNQENLKSYLRALSEAFAEIYKRHLALLADRGWKVRWYEMIGGASPSVYCYLCKSFLSIFAQPPFDTT